MREPYKSLIEKLLNGLKKRYKERLISFVVFGSIARGDERRDSDIDVLIIIDGLPKSRLKRQKEFMEIEKEVEREIEELFEQGYFIDFSPILRTPQEAEKIIPLYLDMTEDAIILFDKENFFKSVLEKLKERLKELKAKRVWIGKKWYWILKPDYKFGEVIKIG